MLDCCNIKTLQQTIYESIITFSTYLPSRYCTGIGRNFFRRLNCWARCRHHCPDAILVTHFKALFQFDPVIPLSVIFFEVLRGLPCPLDNSCTKERIVTGTAEWHFYNLLSLAYVQEHGSIRHSFRTSLTAAATWRMRMRIIARI